ncbi:hypothetical protein Clacol_002766 [Clathrus columnatus]|uniref:Nucleoporin Nup159/Nup146 N-terminal domain-containing protein n=1 Tax=Clathrus columnatus TaxID=1419009 RepID=A0AAV5A7D1_9AGAM|nr:hypothetical protein Clacol_002766 [Clathrus columnatus]
MQVENVTQITKTNPLQFQDRRHNVSDDVENTSHTKLSGTPCNIKIAVKDERLLVGMLDGSVIVYDLDHLFKNDSKSDPIFVIPARSFTPIADILPNQGENPELVAILRGYSNEEKGYKIEIFDLKAYSSLVNWHKGEDPSLIPISISWSPKGKQIAIGLQSGAILLFDPHDPNVPKRYIPKSPSVSDSSSSLLSISWLATNMFYLVFSSPESCFPSFDRASTRDVLKTHVILVYEPKGRTALEIEVSEPSPPFGALFPPGPLCCIIKDWPPTKFLLICGDGPSSDIGVIGSTSDENWNHYTFEETSTPTLPLGEGAEDMVLLGLDLDLTSDEPVHISEQPDDGTPDLPPSPILYAYMSDGSIVAWHILYLDGTPFPGMVRSAQAIGEMSSSPLMQQVSERIPSGNTAQTSVIAPAKGFGTLTNQQSPISSFTNTGSETTSTFGFPASSTPTIQTNSGFNNRPPAPTFGVTGWGFGSKQTAPTFGTVALEHKEGVPTASAFGQSGFAGFSTNPPKPASVFSGGGFAAFAQTGTSSFGAPLGTTKTSIFDQPPDSSIRPTTMPPPKSVFGVGGVGLAPSGGSQQTALIFGEKTGAFLVPKSHITSDRGTESDLGSGTTSITNTGSLFGTNLTAPGTASSFYGVKPLAINNPDSAPFSTRDVRALDTMSSLVGSLDATGSPPGSPPTEESPPTSPPLQSTDLPKPMSSYLKPATAFKTLPVTSPLESESTSPFIKPGFGAFQSSSEGPAVFSSFSKPATNFGKSTELSENTIETKPIVSSLVTNKPIQSGFEAKPATPVFGVSGFGQVPKASASIEPSKPVSGGFGAFAGGGFTSFAKPAKVSSFDELLNQGDLKPTKSPLVFGAKSESNDSFSASTGESTTLFVETTKKTEKDEGDEKKKTMSVAAEATTDNTFSLAALSEAVEIPVAVKRDSSIVQERPVIEEANPPTHKIESVETEEVKTEPASTKLISEQEKIMEITKPPQSSLHKVTKPPTPIFAPQPVTPSTTASTESAVSGVSSIITVSGGGAERPASLFAQKPTLSPAPQASPMAGIGLGRPSSRPARSSPLASAPVTIGESTSTPTLQEGIAPPNHKSSLTVSSQPSIFSRKPLDLGNTVSKTIEIPKPSLFGAPVPVPLTPKSNLVATPKAASDSDQHPLQLEFIRIYEEFCSELKDLERRLEALKALFPVIQEPRGLDKLVSNNEESREKVLPLLDEVKSGKLRLAELQNLALISETRLEELTRWVRAKEDPGFAKSLKPKSLGPEHTENQLRLRKLLQNTLSRLQQCEDIMEAMQKKLNQEKNGHVGLQAPTLDTIDRTCRNIKIALDERTDIVDKLSERVEALSPRRKPRYPVIGTNLGPLSPASAASTAVAALNSERFCLSLKNALFQTRQRPLFTDTVTKAPSTTKSFNLDTAPNLSKSEKSYSSPIYNNTITTPPDSGSDSFLNNHESVDRRRQSRKHTSIAVPLRNSAAEEATTSTTSSSFNWGPLPSIVSTPSKKLPFEFKIATKDAT